ncbi:MAG: serine protease [Bacteroidales bacterium]|nr:serine protease [Bacteroidales bacterium]
MDDEDRMQVGTGFFVDKEHIITANHIVADAFDPNYSVQIIYGTSKRKATTAQVMYQNPRYDVNVLKVEEALIEDIEFVKITSNFYREHDFSYSAYGFPNSKPEGHYQSGKILDEQIISGQSFFDVSLGDGRLSDYCGFSGSPVVSNGQLVGIAVEQTVGLNNADSITVLSVDTFADMLNENWLKSDSFINEIFETFRHESKSEINQNKKSKKYIPEIFVENGEIKELLRGFSDPILFYDKHVEYAEKHNFEQYNKLLDKYGINRIPNITYDSEITLDSVDGKVGEILTQMEDIFSYAKLISDTSRIRKTVPNNHLNLFDASFYGHSLYRLRWEIEYRIKLFDSLKNAQVLLTEKAGQGKTNLVCDFTENVLLRKNIPCWFISARALENNNICDTMLGLFSYNFSIDELLKIINETVDEKQYPFVIVIDGINEQIDMNMARNSLYKFLNKMKKYNRIRVLMTSRVEYFEEKFGDLKVKCPQVKIIDSYEQGHRNYKLNARVFDGYMKHFNIQITDMDDSVCEQLCNDYLLLRIFSEAYQGTKEDKTTISSLLHLYRYEIFEKYYEYKNKSIEDWDRAQGNIDTKSTYDNLVNTVTEYMIEHMQFNNIERSIIVGKTNNDLLVKLIDEDIIFREDIVKKKGLVEASTEVINFTFDEFRDFCIVKKLLENFNEENLDDYESLISSITSPDSAAAEGIQKYLFFASKKHQNKYFTQLLKNQNWFTHIYLSNIFSVNEELITEEDVNIIKSVLSNMDYYKSYRKVILNIYRFLIERYNIKEYKRLNIRLLLTILEKINSADFEMYVFRLFKNDYGYTFGNENSINTKELVEQFKYYYKQSFNQNCLLFLAYLQSKRIYTYNFLQWSIEAYPEETIAILEDLNDSDDNFEIKMTKDMIKELSYCDLNVEPEISERLEHIKETQLQNRKPQSQFYNWIDYVRKTSLEFEIEE